MPTIQDRSKFAQLTEGLMTGMEFGMGLQLARGRRKMQEAEIADLDRRRAMQEALQKAELGEMQQQQAMRSADQAAGAAMLGREFAPQAGAVGPMQSQEAEETRAFAARMRAIGKNMSPEAQRLFYADQIAQRRQQIQQRHVQEFTDMAGKYLVHNVATQPDAQDPVLAMAPQQFEAIAQELAAGNITYPQAILGASDLVERIQTRRYDAMSMQAGVAFLQKKIGAALETDPDEADRLMQLLAQYQSTELDFVGMYRLAMEPPDKKTKDVVDQRTKLRQAALDNATKLVEASAGALSIEDAFAQSLSMLSGEPIPPKPVKLEGGLAPKKLQAAAQAERDRLIQAGLPREVAEQAVWEAANRAGYNIPPPQAQQVGPPAPPAQGPQRARRGAGEVGPPAPGEEVDEGGTFGLPAMPEDLGSPEEAEAGGMEAGRAWVEKLGDKLDAAQIGIQSAAQAAAVAGQLAGRKAQAKASWLRGVAQGMFQAILRKPPSKSRGEQAEQPEPE